MSKYILSIDQGTTSSRACLFDKSGHLVVQAQRGFQQIYPQAGWVEHDPEEIWRGVVDCLKDVLKKYPATDIVSLGITNQRETVVLWDARTGQPVYNAIVWQCRRTADLCKKLKPFEKKIQNITGLVIDPYFSATKIQWILKNSVQAKKVHKEGYLLAGTMDTFLIWRLTSGMHFVTDVTNASRTSLMDLKTRQWSTDCLKIFKINKSILPVIKASNDFFGHVNCTELKGLIPSEFPIHGVAGDQQAALFGQACFNAGSAKCTFGTGSFILFNCGHKITVSKKGLLTTMAWELKGFKPVYALEGGAFVCGAAVTWLRDGLNMIQASEEIESLAKSVNSSEGVEFVPALSGLGAPHWVESARGIISGITRKTTKAHIARATLEALALQNLDIIKVMEQETKKRLLILKTDGGASKNNLLMQMQSDFLGRKVLRSKVSEATALGVAFISGLGVGFWRSPKEIEGLVQADQFFAPAMTKASAKKRLDQWTHSIKRLVGKNR